MRLVSALVLSAVLGAALPAALVPAFADALPMPVELNEAQKALIGVWQEQNQAASRGLGHGFTFRTVTFGNTDMTMTTFGGISYSNDFSATAMVGTWSAKRVDDKTWLVTMDQGGGRGTDLTIVFDGPDGFTLADSERAMLEPSAFRRVGDGVRTEP